MANTNRTPGIDGTPVKQGNYAETPWRVTPDQNEADEPDLIAGDDEDEEFEDEEDDEDSDETDEGEDSEDVE